MAAEGVPEWVRALPNVNAALNAASATFLVNGYRHVRRRRFVKHRTSMIGALIASTLFMASYLTYHFWPGVGSVKFVEPEWFRPIYLLILIPHVILAALVVPLAAVVVYFAVTQRLRSHRRIARIALPIWLYVSVTGVMVYVILYIVYPQA